MDYKEIKSYEDACKVLGLTPISDEAFNVFGQDAKTMSAYHKLTVITRAINEGWQPDWNNSSERKYEPYMYNISAGLACADAYKASTHSNTSVGSCLCFCNYERCLFAVKTFGNTLYKDYFRPEITPARSRIATEVEKLDADIENSGDVIM